MATYGSVDKVDLWVAGLAEKHLPGSSLGETFTRILVDQFLRLRDGVRQLPLSRRSWRHTPWLVAARE